MTAQERSWPAIFLVLCFQQENTEQDLLEPFSTAETVLIAHIEHCLNPINVLSVTVQRMTLFIKAPMLLGCKLCTCLLTAEDFHSWCVLVIVFPCSGLADCSIVGWELGVVSDVLEVSAVSSVDHKAKKTWILLFSVVAVYSSSYLQVFLCCRSQQRFKEPCAFSGKRTCRVWLLYSCSVFPVQQEV